MQNRILSPTFPSLVYNLMRQPLSTQFGFNDYSRQFNGPTSASQFGIPRNLSVIQDDDSGRS
jgi:hypothetical protein